MKQNEKHDYFFPPLFLAGKKRMNMNECFHLAFYHSYWIEKNANIISKSSIVTIEWNFEMWQNQKLYIWRILGILTLPLFPDCIFKNYFLFVHRFSDLWLFATGHRIISYVICIWPPCQRKFRSFISILFHPECELWLVHQLDYMFFQRCGYL